MNPPGRSASVAPLDLEEFHAIYRVRRLLEPDLARRAVPRLTDAELNRLYQAAAEFGGAERSMDDIYDDHRAFHLALLAPAASAWDIRILTIRASGPPNATCGSVSGCSTRTRASTSSAPPSAPAAGRRVSQGRSRDRRQGPGGPPGPQRGPGPQRAERIGDPVTEVSRPVLEVATASTRPRPGRARVRGLVHRRRHRAPLRTRLRPASPHGKPCGRSPGCAMISHIKCNIIDGG